MDLLAVREQGLAMTGRLLFAAIVCASLVACASAQEQRERRQGREAASFLERQGSIGDPGRVAAADFAFARMARDEGTWTAFRYYAAPDAIVDASGGWASAEAMLGGLEDPPEPILWAPTRVWSSCNGQLAATLGRSLRPNGIAGTYITIWELQPNNTYRWIYDTGAADDPQPEPVRQEEIPEDAIVVPGLTAVEGYVADCARRGEPVPAPPAMPAGHPASTQSASQLSHDRTLRWTRSLAEDGSRLVSVEWLRNGEWQTAVELEIPPPPGPPA